MKNDELLNEDGLIRKDIVIEDMYNDDSSAQSGARSYYYIHYATEEERKRMDREDLFYNIIGTVTVAAVIVGIVAAVIYHFIK